MSETAADWQANSGGTLSGDWSDVSHWSTGAVPGATDAATIQDNPVATAPWLVTATAESAASLLLDMDLGTFEATGGLTVGGTLDQASGGFAMDQGGLASVGAFTQTGGDMALADGAHLLSGGTDTVNGTTTLQDAMWSDAALGIGAGLIDSTMRLESTVTLGGSLVGSTLGVAGALQIGGDPFGDTAGGAGTLTLDNGSVATAATLFLFAGSVATLDGLSALDVGTVATAVGGAVSIAADGGLTADIGTVGGDLLNAGSVSIVAYIDFGTNAESDGDVLIAGGLVSSGTVNVGGPATLTVAGSVELDGGGVSVDSGSTLNVDAGVVLAGGQLTLDGAVLNSTGTLDTLFSDATLTGGATWNTNGLAIMPASGDRSLGTDATLSLADSVLADTGSLVMGDDSDPRSGSFHSGTLTLLGNSAVSAGGLQMHDNSALTLAAASSVVVGTAQAVAGAVAIGAGATLVGNGGTIAGDVVDGGVLSAEDVFVYGGDSFAGYLGIGGTLGGSGTVEISGDAALEVGDASGFAGSIFMSPGPEPTFRTVLTLDSGDLPDATVIGDGLYAVTIDVRGLAYDGGALTAQVGSTASQLVVSNAATSATLGAIVPGQDLGDFMFADDGHGGTFVIDVPCYVAGTTIAVASGEVPVEALRPGDLVRTADGRLVPVRWVGRRRVDPARHPRPWRVAPVRIAAGAIAPGVPSRDLWVSPDHAIFLGGRLVPAARLANGATVARDDGFGACNYVHVELDRHEILLANGCPAESFLDTGNRGLFADAAGPRALFAEFPAPDPQALAIWAARGAAPLLLDGAALDDLRAGLAARAVALGWRAGCNARPRLLADGRALRMRDAGEGVFRARVPAGVGRLVVQSATFVPADGMPGSGDTRRLGLGVRAVRLDGAAVAAFGRGWHAADGGVRWSDGAGEIVLPPRRAAATLELWTLPGGPYWAPPRGCQFGPTLYPVRTELGRALEWDRTG